MRRAALWLWVWLLVGCDTTAPPEPVDQYERPARLYRLTPQAMADRHQFVGSVQAAQSIDIAFEVGGNLERLLLREGQTIRRGTLMAALNKREFELRAREAAVQLKIARQDFERKQKLLERGGISESTVVDARTLLELRRVQLQQARKTLADTELRAPFDAYVANRYVDNFVVVSQGQPIGRIHDLTELVIAANVPQHLLATVTPDQVLDMHATFDFAPGLEFPLTYRENRGEAASVAQTYEVTFTMARPETPNILPGMTATVALSLRSDGDGERLSIPSSALTSDAEDDFIVWRFDPQTRDVTRQPVRVEPGEDGFFTVTSGLAAGDVIVAAGAHQLQPGMRVRPMNAP